MKRTRIQIWLPTQDFKTLKQASKLAGISMSDMVNAILALYVVRHK